MGTCENITNEIANNAMYLDFLETFFVDSQRRREEMARVQVHVDSLEWELAEIEQDTL